MDNPANTRSTNLDLIKTLAAILIVFHHYQVVFTVTFSGINFYGGSFYFGRIVELFFIISGFVTALHDGKYGDKILKPFFKKCLRIYPPTALAVTFTLLVFLVYRLALGVEMPGEECTPPRVIASYLLVFAGWGIDVRKGVDNPTWYLCVLILCYILFYAVKCIGRGHRRMKMPAYILIAAGSIVLEQSNWGAAVPFIGNSNVRGYGSFFIGVLLYEFTQHVKNKKLHIATACTAIVLFILLSLKYGCNHWQTLELLLFPGLVLLAVSVEQIPCRALSFWGGVSFEVYLWHIPLIRLGILIMDLCGISVEHSYLTMVLFTAVVECAAVIVYKYFEVPLTRTLNAKLERQSHSPR